MEASPGAFTKRFISRPPGIQNPCPASTERSIINGSWHAELGRQFTELARAMTPRGYLDAAGLVEVAATLLGRNVSAGLTLLPARGGPRTLAATDELPRVVDALQYSLSEGPCLEAIRNADLALSGDLAHDNRWPTFGPRCANELGVFSMLGVRLLLQGPERGALNFYAPPIGAFTETDGDRAAALSPFVSLVLQNELHSRRIADLEAALESSRQIGIGVGILMARHLIPAEDAFARLSRASQDLNRKLRDLAQQVELTGELPGSGDHDQAAASAS
ncbi:MAG TPA: GAF and ANTAR domain-containing protein [Sporichthyaceae bacterium]